MKILVTGGAGFIGSWLIRYLLQDWAMASQIQRLVNLDALCYAGNLDNLDSVKNDPRYSFVQGDITDPVLVKQLMADTTVCINVAAQTHVDRSIEGPEVFTHTNVWGTQVLLEAARQAGVQQYIQISTDEVYGSLGETGAFSETTPLDPSSPYSASKAGADMLALSYHKTYGMHVCVTRCSNNYGPNQYPEKLIPLFVLRAMAHESLPMYGDGLNIRDWIHVKDHARAVALVLEKGRPGEVYNIGGRNEWNNLAITQEILRLCNRPESLITPVADRLGHDRRYAIDPHKIETELGWHPQIDFSTGLAETVAWYQNNAQWIARIQARQLTGVA